MLNIGHSQIWRYENNKTSPSGEILAKISTVLNVSTDYLLGLTDDPMPQLRVDNLSAKERAVLSAMRHGDAMEAIKIIVNDP